MAKPPPSEFIMFSQFHYQRGFHSEFAFHSFVFVVSAPQHNNIAVQVISKIFQQNYSHLVMIISYPISWIHRVTIQQSRIFFFQLGIFILWTHRKYWCVSHRSIRKFYRMKFKCWWYMEPHRKRSFQHWWRFFLTCKLLIHKENHQIHSIPA